MSCCEKMIKYIIFVFNLVFFLTSCALVGIGIYIQIHMKKYLDFLGETYLSTSIVLIIIGSVMLVVTFFGCCGACTENHCMLYTYGTILTLILLSLIGVAIAIYIFKDDVKTVIEKGMSEGTKHFGEPGHDGVTEAWNIIQNDLQCCGVQSYIDWRSDTFLTAGDVPDSCCKVFQDGCGKGKGAMDEATASQFINTKGCLTTFEDYITTNAGAAAGIGVAIAVVIFLGIIVSCCVARSLQQKNMYV